DDRDAARAPGLPDEPGNGVDEDCSGADEAPRAPTPRQEAEPVASPRRAGIPEDLSLILVTVDTLRAEMGYTGYPRPISPSLDRLAAESVAFERAYSLASYTGKSLGPMLIGKYTGETRRSFNHFDKFGTDETFLQERLKRAGFRTLSAQGHNYFLPESGLGRGFDELDRSAIPKVTLIEGDRTVNSDRLTDAAISLLSKEENVRSRFYLWVHYLDPHADYVPHPGFEFGRWARDMYDGEVAWVDSQIGRLLDFVRAQPFGKRTIIVFTSDHGEAFGEHGMWRHGFELWEELVRVPLIVHVPGVPAGRVKARRSSVDLVPTMLELLGLPLPAEDAPDFLSGRSWVPDLLDPPSAAPRTVFVDMCEGPYNDERQAYLDADMKLVAARGRGLSLFDLAADPGEKRDLLGDRARAAPVIAGFQEFRRGLRVQRPRKQ
ncbi:MAG: sulfatase-like hydrolase/transferase, partial [Deltaproteobacteria bacterium]|nr:sulfatase-like hydrolase/transferase [Deltaproteobacteria bacterium]